MIDLLSQTIPEKRKSASHGEAGYERRERDFYPTEPWVTRALLAAVDFAARLEGSDKPRPQWSRGITLIWEPACGDGRMSAELAKAGYSVFSSDIHDYGFPGATVPLDFLTDPAPAVALSASAIVTNPPFDLAVAFITKACGLMRDCRGKVAILQRHEFDAPRSNHSLFQPPFPFAAKLVLPRRPRWSDEDKASPRFPYAWYLWDWRHEGFPVLRYLPDPDKIPAATGSLL